MVEAEVLKSFYSLFSQRGNSKLKGKKEIETQIFKSMEKP